MEDIPLDCTKKIFEELVIMGVNRNNQFAPGLKAGIKFIQTGLEIPYMVDRINTEHAIISFSRTEILQRDRER